TTVTEVIGEMPAPIETGYATYDQPQELLRRHQQALELLERVKSGAEPDFEVVTAQGEPVDAMTAVSAVIMQQVLTDELEEINSLLCAPCNCRLCCIGPDSSMQHDFFEIPLGDEESSFFAVDRLDTTASRAHCSMDEEPLQENNAPFYKRIEPALVHWQNGWSLILPKSTTCPNLEPSQGRCRVYADRPEVCRRPQIFPYVIEKLDSKGVKPLYRLRQSLLAIVDCPYVGVLQDEIAAYGAASELEVLFKQNKA
ncbi:MAG: YkgJ family cysteine cluster protein, partial [Desulfobulbaceae bacterium]|nr:YkgJ family cysteine cluster protein [Desulfobulbaceae bacterium]